MLGSPGDFMHTKMILEVDLLYLCIKAICSPPSERNLASKWDTGRAVRETVPGGNRAIAVLQYTKAWI